MTTGLFGVGRQKLPPTNGAQGTACCSSLLALPQMGISVPGGTPGLLGTEVDQDAMVQYTAHLCLIFSKIIKRK